MVDPILSTGLATDWIKRLHKLWSTLRRTREQELQEIRNVFGDPEFLARFYIEPDCQPVNPADHNEDEAIRAFRQPVRDWLNRFLEGEFFEQDGRNTVFFLSDAGMGKTSLLMMLKLTHLLRFWPDGLDFRLMKLGPGTLEKLDKIQSRNKTILLLDALDEDPSAWDRIEERLIELLEATKSFRQVILTCRTQFFPEGGPAPVDVLSKIVVGGFICNLLYLSPFDNEQVEAYLRKVYPNRWWDLVRKWWKKEDNPKLEKARKIVEPMKSLRLRPMLLAHIEELVQADIQEWREFLVYNALVRHWLLREQRKQRGHYTEGQLWEACEEVAIFLQKSGKRILSLEDLKVIQKNLPAAEALETFDISGRSLLNRTSDRGLRFSHYSIQEFLVSNRLVSGRWERTSSQLSATAQLISFLISWSKESPDDRLSRIPWWSLDLRGVYFSGPLAKVFRGADLKEAWLENATFSDADLAESDLRRASLRNCTLYRVDMRNVDAREADFSSCSIIQSNLSFGRFARANFQGVHFEETALRGTGFLGAEGFPPELRLDETAGPPSPRMLKPTLLFKGNSDEFVSAFASVSVQVDENFASSLMLPRALAWLSRRGLFSVGAGCHFWSLTGLSGLGHSWIGAIKSLVWTSDEKYIYMIRGSNFGWLDLDDPEFFMEHREIRTTTTNTSPQVKEEYPKEVAIGCYGVEGILLASTYGRYPVTISNLQTASEIHQIKGRSDQINSLAWRPDNPVLAVAAADGTVLLWDLRFGQVTEYLLQNPPFPVVSFAWNSSGTLLAAILTNGSVCVWSVDRRALLALYAKLPIATTLAWSPRENQIALLSGSKEIVLWDVFEEHSVKLPIRASAVAWHPQGNLLALAALQGAIEIWDVSRDVPRLRLSLFEVPPFSGLVVTADGYVDGPPEALEAVRFADGLALYDLTDLPERHDSERVRRALAILGP